MITPFDDSDAKDALPVFPTIAGETYQELFQMGRWMVAAQPWRRMADSNCFAVIDPDTGDHQIAAVMGNAGSFYALHIYQPEEGTRWFTRLSLSVPNDPQCRHDAQFDQHLLEIEFTDGSQLDEHDEALMECHGALTKPDAKKKRAPRLSSLMLRSIHPGCPPWHPDQQEATRLLDGLRLLRRFHEDHFDEFEWAVFMPDETGTVSLPTFRLPKGADRHDPAAWEFGMEQFQSPPSKSLPEIPTDELIVARLAKFQVKPGTRWELGSLFSPNPILDDGRPAYPVLAFVGVAESGRVEGLETVSSLHLRYPIFRRSLAKVADDLGYLPEELVVGSPLAMLALEDLAQHAGIRLLPGDVGMPLFDHIAADLLQSPVFRPPEVGPPSGLEDFPPELLRELDDILRKASKAGATKEEVARMIQQHIESHLDPATLMDLASSMVGDNHFEILPERPASGSSTETQRELFVPEPIDSDRYVLRVDLVGMKPPIWRRISLPAESTFLDLHFALQAVFDWDDDHLHEFQVRHQNRIMAVVRSEDLHSNACFDENTTRLLQVFTKNITKVHYVYDFGDNWEHLIKIEKKVPAKPRQSGPECHAGRGIAPLEDCGGIWGYRQLLDGSSEFCEEFDEDVLRHHREGKFSPKDVKF